MKKIIMPLTLRLLGILALAAAAILGVKGGQLKEIKSTIRERKTTTRSLDRSAAHTLRIRKEFSDRSLISSSENFLMNLCFLLKFMA